MNLELLKELNPALYTDEELVFLRNNLEIEYGKVNEMWAEGLDKFADKNFDPYSLTGELSIKNYNKKFSGQASDILAIIDVIDDELAAREKRNDEARYSGKSHFKYKDENIDEFIEKEDNRTLKHRQDIEEDNP